MHLLRELLRNCYSSFNEKKVRFAEVIFAKVRLITTPIHAIDSANRGAYKSVPIRLSVLESVENPSRHVLDFEEDCGFISSPKWGR